MKLSVLTVNWNTSEHLRKCLNSIDERLPDIQHEIIVVDNGSDDGSPDMVRSRHPDVLLIGNGENRGFAAACNQAAARARGEFLLLLNPDIVLEPGAVQELLKFADERPDAAVAPLLALPGNGLQLGPGGLFASTKTAFNHYSLLSRLFPGVFRGIWLRPGGLRRAKQLDWLSGACLLIRRPHFDSAGGFDESFFMYAEDMDLCHRLSEKGARFYLLPVRVIHDHGAAFRSSGSPEYCMDALYNYFIKHHGGRAARRAMLYAWLGLSARAVIL
ncbi:MAG: glycosyltransferase family 2 protein, partial [bacterium]